MLETAFHDDTLVTGNHQCLVFPADGTLPHLVSMITRTVTTEDTVQCYRLFNRCVDLASSYGTEIHKARAQPYEKLSLILYYNLSPRLPINLYLSRQVGFNPTTTSRLFWRGDVIAMKCDLSGDPYIRCLNANLVDLPGLEKVLQDIYRSGGLDRELVLDKWQWKFISSGDNLFMPSAWERLGSWVARARGAYGEDEFLENINELMLFTGRYPLSYDKTPVGRLFDVFRSSLGLTVSLSIIGPPKLNQDIEKIIFEICADICPRSRTRLTLVAQRVKKWIYPILYATVDLKPSMDEDEGQNHWELGSKSIRCFYLNNVNGVSPSNCTIHVRALWIPDAILNAQDRQYCGLILSACTNLENLAIRANVPLSYLADMGNSLRRLVISFYWNLDAEVGLIVYHPCFSNITHLHLYGDAEDWEFYKGWEYFGSLTHLAMPFWDAETMPALWGKIPALLYIVLGGYSSKVLYGPVLIDNSHHWRTQFPPRVVKLDIPMEDWDRGTRGYGDFWDVAEQEVARRLA